MRRLLVTFALLGLTLPVLAQNYVTPKGLENVEYKGRMRIVDANPAGNACTLVSEPTALAYHSGTTWTIHTCQSSVWTAVSAGTGDGTHPGLAVDNEIVRFSGTTGKVVQAATSGGPTISDTGTVLIDQDLQVKRGPVYNVKAWGAVCDGATDDTAAIQAAIDAAELVGGTVLVPAATCNITALTIDANHVTLSGTGNNSTLQSTSTTASAITVTSAHVEIRQLVVDGDASRDGTAATTYSEASEAAIDAGKHGISFLPATPTGSHFRLRIIDVNVRDQPDDGIYAKNPEFLYMQNVISQSNGRNGIHLNGKFNSKGISNILDNVRASSNGDKGFYIRGIGYSTLIHPQALSNSGSIQIFVHGGKGVHLINRDV